MDYAHAQHVPALSSNGSDIYSIDQGVWYVSINRTSGRCALTSADVWYAISRVEADNWLNYGGSMAPAQVTGEAA